MGECVNCGHCQPGVRDGDAVEPLAESGCCKCGSRAFDVAEDEQERVRPSAHRILA
ncbi:hypothetical protein G9464_05145 [Halostella sp. JP-L12]|uniref:hypothetical protein n=1 Tax=Halostella TaxID=1843185 RepID=UPI0013CE78AA|nr:MULTISPECIES: hypothetical protein [Halostella]NHN46981.1 hypothetical protein [Halostella sp. JP-L12]